MHPISKRPERAWLDRPDLYNYPREAIDRLGDTELFLDSAAMVLAQAGLGDPNWSVTPEMAISLLCLVDRCLHEVHLAATDLAGADSG